MPKHKLIGGRRVSKGSRTKKVLTAEEVKNMSKQAPDLMSRKIEEEEDQKFVYRVEFDLTATRNTRYSNIIQILFDQMCVHDPECCIKSYFENNPTDDIVKGMNIGEQCWNAKRFNNILIMPGIR